MCVLVKFVTRKAKEFVKYARHVNAQDGSLNKENQEAVRYNVSKYRLKTITDDCVAITIPFVIIILIFTGKWNMLVAFICAVIGVKLIK